MTKSKRMRWAGHVAHMGGEEEYIQCFAGRDKRKKTTRKTET
jgi:hypothetical protein